MTLPLSDVLKTLGKYYGKPPAPVSTDPFQLIFWEQVAYLVPDAKRKEAYTALRTQVGLTPAAAAWSGALSSERAAVWGVPVAGGVSGRKDER